MKKWRKLAPVLCLVLLAVASAAFGQDGNAVEEQKTYRLFFMDSSETKVGEDTYTPERDSLNFILQNLIDIYNTGRREAAARYLPNEITIETWSIENGTLTINFSDAYHSLGPEQEILVRAALVRTFTQFPDVLFVNMTVDGERITDAYGEPVGRMSADSFVELNSLDKDAYRYDTFTLYFTDKDQRRLVPESRRVYYRRSIPKARVALEQLARGPLEEGHYPSIPSTMTVNSVLLSDAICYADVSGIFLSQPVEGISPELASWSVAHTLIANTVAEKVEILVDGESGALFGELDLYRFFSWNPDLAVRPEDL